MREYKFTVQEAKKVRVIVDTDAACEADDQYAIVHALLTPRFLIKGIIAEQFANAGGENSVDRSYEEIVKLERLTNSEIPVFHGLRVPLASEEDGGGMSDGVELIIREAGKEDDRPLFVLCQGAITNVAAALVRCPEIAGKFVCIWIGGASYPDGGWEFNLTNDFHAANVVFKSELELWQVPMSCYTRMQIGYAELQLKVMPCGKIGQYLFDEMQEVGKTADWISGESWALGDSPAIGLALNAGCGRFEERNAPICDKEGYYVGETGHRIRVYHEIDSRFILEDFFAKLQLCFRK